MWSPTTILMITRRRFLSCLSSAAVVGGNGMPLARAQEPQRSRDRAGLELVSPTTTAAIDQGLAFLGKRQIAQGQLKGAFGTSGYAAGVAVCGLAGLAFLSSGSVPGRGPYGRHIDRCVDYLLANTDSQGYISAQAFGGQDRMYGHGFATLFLAEAFGMSMHSDEDQKLGNKLRAAVKLIVETQNDEGGWRYQPVKSEADLSITICQIMALRAARDAGLEVPAKTRERCIDYVKRSQTGDGTFQYLLRGGRVTVGLTAAGVVALNSAGIYDGPEVDKGLKYIWRNKPNGQMTQGHFSGFFYTQYYAAVAMWHAGGDYWSGWYTDIRDTLLKHQRTNGGWDDAGFGEEYGAAMALIILQLPYNYVPVFGEG
jgi:prenyltransferase beta subunit